MESSVNPALSFLRPERLITASEFLVLLLVPSELLTRRGAPNPDAVRRGALRLLPIERPKADLVLPGKNRPTPVDVDDLTSAAAAAPPRVGELVRLDVSFRLLVLLSFML